MRVLGDGVAIAIVVRAGCVGGLPFIRNFSTTSEEQTTQGSGI